MKNRMYWGILIILTVVSSLIAGCNGTTTTTSTTATNPTTSTTQTQSSTTSSVKTSTTALPHTSSTQVKPANWWDSLGAPKYGGTMNMATTMWPGGMDPYLFMNFGAIYESLFACDWSMDRKVFDFKTDFTPDEYWVPWLVGKWEWTNPTTFTGTLRQGIKWHNKAPVNGREFTAQDVQYHYDRMTGKGSGFTTPNPMQMQFSGAINKVSATDKYTFVIEFKNAWPVKNFWSMLDINSQWFEAKEYIDLGKDAMNDWKNVVSTGPYFLTDFVQDTSYTLSKNPDYWATDSRYPQNKLPYIETVKMLKIGDIATQLAALRTAKIDMVNKISRVQAESMVKTNPELAKNTQLSGANCVYFRVDKGPMQDIKVRQALAMSIDRKGLQDGFYKGEADTTPFGVIYPIYKEYAYLYKDWPQELKDKYAFNMTKARALMTEAGYPNGFKTSIVTPSDYDMEMLQIIKASFSQIGVDMEIKIEQGSAMNAILNGKLQEQMDYGQGGATHPWIMLQNIKSTGQNRATHNDKAFDAIVDNFFAAKNTAEAKNYSVEADKYTIEQFWALRVGMLNLYNFWQPSLKGYNGEVTNAPTTAPGQWWWSHFWLER